jgi:CelD/BcsL family acetyltransferase involved in cellulose biosynthesis
VHPEFINEVIKSLLEYFKDEAGNNWDVIIMSGILKDSAASELSRYFSYNGYEIYEVMMDVCPYVKLDSTWDNFLNRLSKKSRYNVRKKQRTLGGAYNNRFYVIRDSRDLEKAIDITAQLHKKRMKMKGSKNFSVSDDFWAFQLELAKKFVYKGWLFLGILEINGRPIASQYAFKFSNKIYHYQSGFDPNYKKYSVGLISIGQMIKNSIYEGIKEYDFLRGKEFYKYHWANNEREIFSVYIVNKNYKGHLFLAKKKIINFLKSQAKDLFGSISPAHRL